MTLKSLRLLAAYAIRFATWLLVCVNLRAIYHSIMEVAESRFVGVIVTLGIAFAVAGTSYALITILFWAEGQIEKWRNREQ